MLSVLEYVTRSSSVYLEEIKLITIINWIFHVADLLRSFMISFKDGLTSLRDYSVDRFFFLSSLLSYSFLPFSVPKVTYTN